jgi:hypothetical protein
VASSRRRFSTTARSLRAVDNASLRRSEASARRSNRARVFFRSCISALALFLAARLGAHPARIAPADARTRCRNFPF